MIVFLFLTFIVLIALGIPIAFSMGLAALINILSQPVPTVIVFQRMVAGVNSFPLIALPLFVLAGSIMHQGRVSEKLMGIVHALVGTISGGLAIVTCLSSCLFGFITGSSVADVAATGSVMMPEMARKGYSKGFAASLQACAGVLGGIIPPSIILVILGVIGGLSIGDLLLGAVIPGWLFGGLLMVTSYVISRKRNYGGRDRGATAKEIRVAAREAFLPLLTPVIVLGGMYSGAFTPTEAAGVAVIYATFLSTIVYRAIPIADFYKVFQEAILISVAILFIIACGSTFGWIMVSLRAPDLIKAYFLSLTTNPILIMILINGILLLLGMIMEGTALAIIFFPVFLPLVVALGWDPIHFGVLFALNIAVGAVTPPVGVALMTACKISDIPYPPPFKEYYPLVVTMMVGLVLVIAFPSLTLWLVK